MYHFGGLGDSAATRILVAQKERRFVLITTTYPDTSKYINILNVHHVWGWFTKPYIIISFFCMCAWIVLSLVFVDLWVSDDEHGFACCLKSYQVLYWPSLTPGALLDLPYYKGDFQVHSRRGWTNTIGRCNVAGDSVALKVWLIFWDFLEGYLIIFHGRLPLQKARHGISQRV